MSSRPISSLLLPEKAEVVVLDCDICGETCNRSNHKHAMCTKCSSDVCRECIRTCLLQSVQDPCCPNCKDPWDLEFLNSLCGSTWTFQTLRLHRQNLLMDREKAKIPGDMEAISMYKQYLDVSNQATKLSQEVEDKHQAWVDAVATRDRMFNNAERVRLAALGLKPNKKDAWKFIQPCPGADCPGFVSTVGKCPVCEIWTCMSCHEIKGAHKDSEHECKQENIASTNHIKKNTKRCPECGVPCMRVSGCTQMWCPQCHCSFSYRTGEVYKAPVHNPERSLWIENGRTQATRKRKSASMGSGGGGGSGGSGSGATCGNQLVNMWTFRTNVFKHIDPSKRDMPSEDNLRCIYHAVADLEGYALDRIRTRCQENSSKVMRIQYALNVMDETKMKKKLEQDDRKRQHWTQVLNVVTLLYEVTRDVINHMARESTTQSIQDGMKQFRNIVQHVHIRLGDINSMTKLQTPMVRMYSLLRHSHY